MICISAYLGPNIRKKKKPTHILKSFLKINSICQTILWKRSVPYPEYIKLKNNSGVGVGAVQVVESALKLDKTKNT
jgi:hypothetical protein